MAVVSRKSKPAPETDAGVSQPKAADEPQFLRLELKVLGRYWFAGVLYEKGKVYEFAYEAGREMLAHDDDLGRPVFTLSKPKVKYVQVAVDDDVVRVKKPRGAERISMPLDDFVRTQSRPVAEKIDLSDDDPEITARLKQIDETAPVADGEGQVI
jgi:hypothetical protein